MTNDLAIPSSDRPNGHQREHLREAGAGMVRYLMRARLKVQPNAFRPKQIARWDLEDWHADDRSVQHLLQLAYNTILEINDKFLQRCGSGGLRVDCEDQDAELKEKIGFFVEHQCALPEALRACWTGTKLDWDGLARWDEIDRIRELLDDLPILHPERESDRRSDETEIDQPIVLRGPSEQPIVLGTFVPMISKTQFHIVDLLIHVAPERLPVAAIAGRLAEARIPTPEDLGRPIRDLADSHENWRRVLILPGRGGRNGYGVRTAISDFEQASERSEV
jgi:hypothetical protein